MLVTCRRLSHFLFAIPVKVGLRALLRIAGIVDRTVQRFLETAFLVVLDLALRLWLFAIRPVVERCVGRMPIVRLLFRLFVETCG